MRAVGSLIDVIRERGPLTVAAFMDLALYHPTFGYYTRAAQRSGRAGDFFTSVDVGPLFGELLAIQFAEMFELLPGGSGSSSRDELVEAGAGNGRLALDVLRGFERHAPRTLARVGLSLVESSAAARAEHTKILEPYAGHLKSSAAELPDEITGILYANEILDAFPVHQVVMRADGLKEMYVEDHGGVLMTREGPLSDDRLARHFDGLDVTLAPGWIAEVSLAAIDWVRGAARRLRQGFLVFVDYGHPARELYSVTHSQGTLTSFTRHHAAGPDTSGPPRWLSQPGEQDITAHVDFTSIQHAAESEGMTTIALMDQTYFVMGIMGALGAPGAQGAQSAEGFLRPENVRALKTLLLPGGLGSTMKVLILGKGVGTPHLRGCSYRVRIT